MDVIKSNKTGPKLLRMALGTLTGKKHFHKLMEAKKTAVFEIYNHLTVT